MLDTPPLTPVSRHYTGDPDVGLAEASETKTNMANNAFIKLPEFWEFSPMAWFAQTEAQFAIRDITDDTTRYHVVSALGRSTATRAANFLANPPDHGKYRDLKAFLLKTFGLSQSERAQRLLAIRGLGDRKPSEHMEMMLNLLGAEEPNFLLMELFLQHMPPQVRTALAGTRITEPRALAEEADRFFLAAQSFAPVVLAPTRSAYPPDSDRLTNRAPVAADGRASNGMCYFHARFGAKAKRCRSPCNFKPTGNAKACAH